MNPTPLIDIQHLTHIYQGKTVLDVTHLDFFPQTITGLAGPNGSGKSTLLHILGLVMKPTSGNVSFMGSPVGPQSVKARRKIVLLPQEPYLLKRSVFGNVAYGLQIRNETDKVNERVCRALETVGLSPDRFADRHAHHLSGGEARRVALAARLVLAPDVLLLDEPTAHVDEKSSRMIQNAVIQACRSEKTTLVVSSHDKEWLHSISDRVLTLFNGHLFDHGRINIIYGPWEKDKNGRHRGVIKNSPFFFPVPPPPHDQAVAILPAKDLHVCKDACRIPPNSLSLTATVTGIYLESKKNTWVISLKSGEFMLISTADTTDVGPVKPGDFIHIYYSPEDVSYR